MYPKDLNEIADPGVRHTIMIARKIVLSLIDELMGHGFALSVDDGEERHPWTTDRNRVIDAIMESDEDYLWARKPEYTGGVFLVYGNDGWDVICDYSMGLEPFMVKTMKLAEKLET